MSYTMDIETAAGVKQHPFHLGTIREIAETFVLEALRRPEVRTVALRLNRNLIGIYDWRDLPETPEG